MTTYKTKILILTLITLWLGIFGLSPGYALTLNEAQKLLASDGAARDNFGFSMFIYQDTAVIGAISDDDNGADSGSAYIFERDGSGVWSEQQKLTASDGAAGDNFGIRVSIYENTAMITAYNDDDKGTSSGSTYVFVRNGSGVWSEQQKLTASDGAAFDRFGSGVEISGDTAMIGAWLDDSETGAVYVFERDGSGVWSEQQKLTANDPTPGSTFGLSVAISGNSALIGAFQDDDNGYWSGSAYVFVRDGAGVWSEQQKLIASDGADGDRFGIDVSLSGDTAVVGSHYDDDDNNVRDTGSVYVFVRDGAGVWTEQQKLTASDGTAGDELGTSVSIFGDTIVAGAIRDDDKGRQAGSAYVFALDGSGVWREQQKLTASDAGAGDWFGYYLKISGNTVMVGQMGVGDGTSTGSVYVFDASASDLIIEKLINHRVRETPATAAQMLVGTRYRADYKITNNSSNRIYRVRVFEDGQLVCNLYSLMPGQSKQPSSCANFQDVLSGLNNVPANVTAKVSGSNQNLVDYTNAYYTGFGNQPGKLKVTHYVNDNNADTKTTAVEVNSNQAEIVFRVENTGSIKLYRVKTYHDPASPINSGWQQQCFFGTLDPGQVRYCQRTISVTESGLNKAFGRAQGEDANVNPTGFINASNPTYFNVVLP